MTAGCTAQDDESDNSLDPSTKKGPTRPGYNPQKPGFSHTETAFGPAAPHAEEGTDMTKAEKFHRSIYLSKATWQAIR
jgi:hypothetical protein